MKNRICIALLGVFLAAAATSWGAPPVVSNIRASQRVGTQLVDIYYNISDPDSTVVTVYLAISADAGTNYNVPAYTFGPGSAIGAGVAVGIDRHIAWNAGSDWTGQFSAQCKVRLIADDGSGPTAPVGMVFIPSGTFQMGDNFGLNSSSIPVHPVYVSAFFMEKFEVTKQLWDEVYGWANLNGYGFLGAGSAPGPALRGAWPAPGRRSAPGPRPPSAAPTAPRG